MGKFIDLTNKKFDRLTVIKRVEDYIDPSGKPLVMWECECECGNKIIVRGISLRHHNTKSCGCLNNEKRRKNGKNNKKYNKYDLSGEYGIGYTSKDKKFLFDIEDYDKIKDYCWHIKDNGYVSAFNIYIHQLIMDFPNNMIIDHINHNVWDNRKENLRLVTSSQNLMNRKISKNNTSGYVGVYYRKDRDKWQSYIMINKKRISLGAFKDKEDAIKARKEAEEKYFGEYSYDNSMKGDEIYEQES